MDTIRNIIVEIEKLKQEKKFKEAIALIQRGIAKEHEDYRLYEELCDIYLYQWELEKALKAVNFSLSVNKESATGNYLKWFIFLSKNKAEDALSYLEKSNKLIGNNSEVLRNLGWAYTLVWKADKWIMVLKRALILAPWDELISEDLGMALIGIGKIKEGNALLEKIGKKTI